MKVKTKLSGFDGVKGYEAGATLEGNEAHIMRLLAADAAEPLDTAAKKYYKSVQSGETRMSGEDKAVAEALMPAIKESVKLQKTKARKRK